MCDYCGCQAVPAISLLTKEHDHVADLISQVRAAHERADVTAMAELARQIAATLGPHTAVEEEGLFPILAGEFPDQIERLTGEHRQFGRVLDEAAGTVPTDPTRPGRPGSWPLSGSYANTSSTSRTTCSPPRCPGSPRPTGTPSTRSATESAARYGPKCADHPTVRWQGRKSLSDGAFRRYPPAGARFMVATGKKGAVHVRAGTPGGARRW